MMSTNGTEVCGCCAGIGVSTPRATFQRPGLGSINVRAGDYWSFRDTMVARLSSSEHGPLSELSTRDPAVDFSIALIDAWSVACEVVSFYSERLLSETLLPTAQELFSLYQLAALVSYRPGPGVSATAELAFTLSEAAGAPRAVTLPSGVKVRSTPGPGETAVTFETARSIPARPAWNALRPRLTEAQPLTATTTSLVFAGTTTGLAPGNALFFIADDTTSVLAIIRSLRLVTANIAVDPDAVDHTVVRIDPIATAPLHQAASIPAGPATPAYPPVLAANIGTTVTSGDLTQLLSDAKALETDLFDPLEAASEAPKRVLVFRKSAGVFGNSAPALGSLPPALTGDSPLYGDDGSGGFKIIGLQAGPYKGLTDSQWADGSLEVLDGASNSVFLDRILSDVSTDGFVALRDGEDWGVYAIDAVAETALSEFTISMRTLRLDLDSDDGFSSLTTRGTTVFAASEWIDLPRRPREDALRAGDTEILLDRWAPGLEPGQRVALRGTYADGLAAPAVEMAEIAAVAHDLSPGGGTTLTLAAGLTSDFDRRALRINANIVEATHGETTQEILGSGEPTAPFLQLTAKQAPLTHVTAPVPGGARAEVELRVGGLLWKQVPDLFDAAPQDRVYTITIDDKGKATYGFGDGVMGALPQPGTGNITLNYRTGLGMAGRVAAGQLDILMSRPLGVESVVNPLPAEGGADAESLASLRTGAPLSCRTLERVVSLSDFADFALGYAGIAKSRAEWVKIPGLARLGVVLTVAGEGGAEVPSGGALETNLTQALRDSGIPYTRFRLSGYVPRYFRVAAKVKAHPDYVAADVLATVEERLRDAYSFDNRGFAQAVHASAVIATLQEVEGVEAVVLDLLYDGAIAARSEYLIANRATPTSGAELLTLHPGPLDHLELMA